MGESPIDNQDWKSPEWIAMENENEKLKQDLADVAGEKLGSRTAGDVLVRLRDHCAELEAENARLKQMDINVHFILDVIDAIASQHGIVGTWQQRVEGVRDIAKKGSPAIAKLKAENQKLRAALPPACVMRSFARYLEDPKCIEDEFMRDKLDSWASQIEAIEKEIGG